MIVIIRTSNQALLLEILLTRLAIPNIRCFCLCSPNDHLLPYLFRLESPPAQTPTTRKYLQCFTSREYIRQDVLCWSERNTVCKSASDSITHAHCLRCQGLVSKRASKQVQPAMAGKSTGKLQYLLADLSAMQLIQQPTGSWLDACTVCDGHRNLTSEIGLTGVAGLLWAFTIVVEL